MRRARKRYVKAREFERRSWLWAWKWRRCPWKGCVLIAWTQYPPTDPPYTCEGDKVDTTMAMKKRKAAAEGTTVAKEAKKGVWAKTTPLLAEFLTATMYDDNKPRTPGKLSIQVWGDMWQVTLRDPDYRALIRLEVETPDQLLPALETCLGEKEQPWQWDQYSKKTKNDQTR